MLQIHNFSIVWHPAAKIEIQLWIWFMNIWHKGIWYPARTRSFNVIRLRFWAIVKTRTRIQLWMDKIITYYLQHWRLRKYGIRPGPYNSVKFGFWIWALVMKNIRIRQWKRTITSVTLMSTCIRLEPCIRSLYMIPVRPWKWYPGNVQHWCLKEFSIRPGLCLFS